MALAGVVAAELDLRLTVAEDGQSVFIWRQRRSLAIVSLCERFPRKSDQDRSQIRTHFFDWRSADWSALHQPIKS